MPSVYKPLNYLIVGAGVAGCSLAYELSKYKVQVTLVDAGQIGQQGASAVPVALLNPHRGRTARASELDKAGLKVVWDVRAELASLGLNHGIRQGDILRIASSEKQARLWQKLDGVHWLNSEQMPVGYHAPFGGILIEGGWLEPRIFLKALVDAAKGRGVRVIEHRCVVGLSRIEHGRFQVLLKDAYHSLASECQCLHPDVVVLCPGASQIQGLVLPQLEYVSGDLVTFEVKGDLPYPVAGAIYGLQHGRNVYIGGNHRAHPEDPAAVQRLQKSASWFIPSLKEAKVMSTWSGTRARQEDNQPLLAELAPNLIFFGALSGRGFLCSSYLCKILVENLFSGA